MVEARRVKIEKKKVERTERAMWEVRAILCNMDIEDYRASFRFFKERIAIAKLMKCLLYADIAI